MKFVTVRELRINASKVLAGLGRGGVVVTKNGKPTAALVRLDEDLIDEFVLFQHPRLLKEVEAARREYEKKGAVDHETMKKRVGRRRG